jgi:hypothetical protein
MLFFDYLSRCKPMLGQYLKIGKDSFFHILPDLSLTDTAVGRLLLYNTLTNRLTPQQITWSLSLNINVLSEMEN